MSAAARDTAAAGPARLLGHDFARPDLLIEALTHRGALPPLKQGRRRMRRGAPPRNYERLEFLGDRVLGLVIADLLWHRFETEPEGPLTTRHAQLVRRETLAAIAAEIGIGRHIVLSPSEAASGAAAKPGLLADVMEAVTLFLSHFPHNHATMLLTLPALAATAGTIDTIRCMQGRWNFYHAGVILFVYMDLMALCMILFFLLYPYAHWISSSQ